ncbi:MAG: hypothetical protein OEV94_05860 [Deltaproteobacteria bacterium]|nr:hypothetical protein [Deltaproteobacteria bacterium]
MSDSPAVSSLPVIQVFSFGFKHSGIPADQGGHGGGFVFDCRCLPNPFWDEALRPFSGLDEPVVRFMEASAETQTFARLAEEMVLISVREYRRREYPQLMVSFGCTGGRHRSVYQAARLGARLTSLGFSAQVTHRDMLKAEEQSSQPSSQAARS